MGNEYTKLIEAIEKTKIFTETPGSENLVLPDGSYGKRVEFIIDNDAMLKKCLINISGGIELINDNLAGAQIQEGTNTDCTAKDSNIYLPNDQLVLNLINIPEFDKDSFAEFRKIIELSMDNNSQLKQSVGYLIIYVKCKI